MKREKPASSIDEYLARVPQPARATLQRLRKSIRAAAPKAEEVISYQIPCYRYGGLLVGFAAFKNHCSFFPGAAIIEAHKRLLKGYSLSKGTLRFPVDKPLPDALVKRFVKLRIAQNEARALERQLKKRSRQ